MEAGNPASNKDVTKKSLVAFSSCAVVDEGDEMLIGPRGKQAAEYFQLAVKPAVEAAARTESALSRTGGTIGAVAACRQC